MKKIVLLAMFLSSICFTAESALPNLSNSASSAVKYETPTSSNSNETKNVVSDSSEKYVSTSTKDDASNNSGLANLPDGKAYIGVTTYLSLRDEPFGTVLDRLYNNEEVIIVDRDGDWYEIESSKGTGWVYGKCVFDSPNSKSPSASYSGSINVNEENNSDKDNAVASKDTTTSKSTSTSTGGPLWKEDPTSDGAYYYYTFTDPGDYLVYFVDNSKKTSTASKTKEATTAKKSTNTKSDTSKVTLKDPTKKTTVVSKTKKTSKAKKSTNNKSTKKSTTAKKSTSNKSTKKTSTAKTTSGKLQSSIVSAAKNLVNKYSKSGSFPYASETNGGRLGCAQVATTVLKNAGALNKTSLSCVGTMDLLKQAGWKQAKVPPYKAGDVIFWQGTQKKSGPTHVGIIMENGNNVQAMSNSSSQKKPRYHNANYAELYCVMRKA